MSFLPGIRTKRIVPSEKGKSATEVFEGTIVTKRPDGTLRIQHTFPGDSRTKQSFKEECDINYIMRRYTKNGILPSMIRTDGKYGDYSSAPDFMEAQNIIAHANEQFSALSSAQRERFGNDPAKFLEFANNANNADEMAKLGLLRKEAVKRVREERKAAADALLAQKKPILETDPEPKAKGAKRSVSNPSGNSDQ